MTDCDKCKEYDKEKNYCPVFCNVINDTLTDRAIEELEKIKSEIEQCYYNNEPGVDGVTVFKDDINNIFNTHISELKGENK